MSCVFRKEKKWLEMLLFTGSWDCAQLGRDEKWTNDPPLPSPRNHISFLLGLFPYSQENDNGSMFLFVFPKSRENTGLPVLVTQAG